MSLLDNPDYVADLTNHEYSNRDIHAIWGYSTSTISEHRNALGFVRDPSVRNTEPPEADSEMHTASGDAYTISSRVAWGYEDFRKFIASKGQNPDEVTFEWGVTTNPAGGYWNKLNHVRPKNAVTSASLADAFASIDKKLLTAPPIDFDSMLVRDNGHDQAERAFIPSDMQSGKSDRLGGTETTIQAFQHSLAHAVASAIEHRTEKVYIIDPGDAIEGFSNVSSQRQTNDLNLSEQIALIFKLQYQAITAFLDQDIQVSHVTVPSNHGQVKVGKQQLASTPNDDYGIAVSHMLEQALGKHGAEFVRPLNVFSETATFTTKTGPKVAVIHGHQTKSPQKISEWWQGQDHGRLPAWDADILITGHWHSPRVEQSGDGRWILVAPTLEPSSSWFENLTGRQSTRGALHFGFTETGFTGWEIV